MKLSTVSEVVRDLQVAIVSRSPFSMIRFNDGGLKVMKRFIDGTTDYSTSRQEGIPHFFFKNLIKSWINSANEADYIDSPEFYFIEKTHKKRGKTSPDNWKLLSQWKEIYSEIGININRKFCSPEMGILLFAENARHNLIETIRHRSICCISNYYRVDRILSRHTRSVTVKLIPGFFGNHYDVSYDSIIDEIRKEANDYDLWILASGELGRIYSGEIRRNGGRSIDVGKVVDAWVTRRIDKRMSTMCCFSDNNELAFQFGNGDEIE